MLYLCVCFDSLFSLLFYSRSRVTSPSFEESLQSARVPFSFFRCFFSCWSKSFGCWSLVPPCPKCDCVRNSMFEPWVWRLHVRTLGWELDSNPGFGNLCSNSGSGKLCSNSGFRELYVRTLVQGTLCSNPVGTLCSNSGFGELYVSMFEPIGELYVRIQV